MSALPPPLPPPLPPHLPPRQPQRAACTRRRFLSLGGAASAGSAAALFGLTGLSGCASRPPVPVPLPPAASSVPGSAGGPARGGGDGAAAFVWSRDAESAFTAFSRYLGPGPLVRRSGDDRVWLVLPGENLYPDGRAALAPAARRWLDQVALVMQAWPASEARLVGHTDARGAAAANDALSLERAQSARDWLVARGVPARRLSLAGRGSRDAGAPGGDRRLELLLGERVR